MNSFSEVPGFYACGRVYSLASFALLEPEISSLQKPFSLMYLCIYLFSLSILMHLKEKKIESSLPLFGFVQFSFSQKCF